MWRVVLMIVNFVDKMRLVFDRISFERLSTVSCPLLPLRLVREIVKNDAVRWLLMRVLPEP